MATKNEIRAEAIFRIWTFASEFGRVYEDENGKYFSDMVEEDSDAKEWTENEKKHYQECLQNEADILLRKRRKLLPHA